MTRLRRSELALSMTPMRRLAAACRWAATVFVLGSLFFLPGGTVCESNRCPMSASQRATCRAMGRACCPGNGGAISHESPQAPVLEPALAAGCVPTLAGQDRRAADARSSLPDAAPAVLQGVGLFTLLAVFRI